MKERNSKKLIDPLVMKKECYLMTKFSLRIWLVNLQTVQIIETNTTNDMFMGIY